MEEKSSTTAEITDLRSILAEEQEIKKTVRYYLQELDPKRTLTSFERKSIVESAWLHVIDRIEAFDPAKGAKFKTWARTVAKHFASDEVRRIRHGSLTIKDFRDQPQYPKIIDQLYYQDLLEFLKRTILTYNGRYREVAEMLLTERTKKEMMEATGMSGGDVDAYVCRVRKKMRTDLLKAGYRLCVEP
jgi:RNA polymerase sigma factor (sigma-70 family)